MDAPLDDPLGIGEVDDVGTATRSLIYHRHAVMFGIAVLAGVTLSIFLGYVLWLDYEVATQTNQIFDFRLFMLPILPLLIPYGVYQYYLWRVKREFFQQMAETLGYTYSTSAPSTSVSGSAFTIGHSPTLSDVFSGSYKDNAARLYNFSYTVGYGRDSRTFTESVFELSYSQALPHVLLNMKSELFIPSDVEPVKLEGDFDKYFKLYVTKGAQMEIREIFQPDTMQRFIALFQHLHMEIYGTKIYLINDKPLRGNREQFLDMQSAMDSVFELIIPSLRSVGQDTADMQSVTQPTS